MDFLYLIGGLLGLVLGGELLVRGAVAIARRFDVPPLIIGLTLVGFGTSTPELVTSIQAALAGSPGIAVGNVVGSNIANILLILGIGAMVAPIVVTRAAFLRDGAVLVAASLMCLVAVLAGALGRPSGFLLLAGLVGFLSLTFIVESRRKSAASKVYEVESAGRSAPVSGLLLAAGGLVAGLAITIFAAKFLVMGAVSIATGLGVSEAVIGLTIVAVGTSMPELVTTVIAARKGESDVAFGNVVGSNIFNILGILGATALVKPLAVPPEIAAFDIWVMLAATALLILVAVTGWRISRREGIVLAGLYVLYLLVLTVSFA